MAATMEAAMFIMFNMHACVCMYVHARVCTHVCGGCPTQPHQHPETSPNTTATHSPPQGRYPPKTQ